MPLDDLLLTEYMTTFFGYGRYEGDWWLVGMEEGGGDTVQDIEARLRVWNVRGRRELEDVEMFTYSIAHSKWFVRGAPLQPTWAKLIRLISAAEGGSVDTESIRAYQAARLGRHDSNNCILELLPLPSPSVQDWIYGQHSSLGELRDRATYTAAIAPQRIEHIRGQIRKHRPKAVIFYSRKYRHHWEAIAGEAFQPTELAGLEVARVDRTAFVLTPHPTYTGITNAFFQQAGKALAALREL